MPVEFKDYYQVLGVSSQAGSEEIRKAFRTLARKYHPDVAQDKKAAEEKFKELNEAHEVLSDPESRRKYDLLGAQWKTGAAPHSAPRPPQDRAAGWEANGTAENFTFEGTGFSEFFEEFFGGRASRARRASPFDLRGSSGEGEDFEDPEAERRGADALGDILITLEEALHGALREISVRQPSGHLVPAKTETYSVRIPPGVRAGQTIRVPGKGGAGQGGGRAGDILLRVRYAQNPDWQVRGANLHGQLELAPWEAVLGTTVPVRTLEGTVALKVATGTRQGHQLRIRGKGLPVSATQRGDLFVEVSIQVPAQFSPEEARLWKQLAALSAFNPRQDARNHGAHATMATP